MAYYVYIIQSERDESFYKGFSEDPLRRLQQHNQGESRYTSWNLAYAHNNGLAPYALSKTPQTCICGAAGLKGSSIEKEKEVNTANEKEPDFFQFSTVSLSPSHF